MIAFYAVFMSIALRLLHARSSDLGSLPPLIFAGLVCNGFITLSGTMHYNTFMAIFFAVSGGLLRRSALHPLRAPGLAIESAS